MTDKIPKLLNHICLEVPMLLNFPTFPSDLCLCCGLLKELMIWTFLPDGQSQTRTPPTFAIVLWYTEWCNILLCSLLQSALNNDQVLTPYIAKSSICTNVLFVMPFTNAAVSLFPNFLHVSF